MVMKAGIDLYIFLLVFFTILPSCSPDTPSGKEGGEGGIHPGKEVLSSLEELFPDISPGEVTWSEKQLYYIADFMNKANPTRVWLTKDEGHWMVIKSGISLSNVAPEILSTFFRTAYSAWEIKSAYMLTRKDLEDVCEVCVTRNDNISCLYFSTRGDYIRANDDFREYSDRPVTISQELQAALDNLFDNPAIVDISVIDVIDSEISVGVMDGEEFVTSVFYSNYDWIVNFRDIQPSDLPPAVSLGFETSAYCELRLVHCRTMETDGYKSYLFYVLDGNSRLVIAEFNESGRLTAELSKSHTITKYLVAI
jgi:hypothetical protein